MSIGSTQLLGMTEALFSAKDSNDTALVDYALLGGAVTYCKQVADAMAADASDMGFLAVPASPTVNQIKVLTATLHPQGALTGNDTDFVTLSVVYDDGAGGSETTVASVTTKVTGGTGSWTAGKVYPLTVSAAYVPAGNQLRLKIAKSGAGKVVPITTLSVCLQNE